MATLREKRKRSKAIIVLLLPAIIFLWIVGWGLYWIGHQKEPQKTRASAAPEEDNVTLIPAVVEEPSEIEN